MFLLCITCINVGSNHTFQSHITLILTFIAAEPELIIGRWLVLFFAVWSD